MRFGVTAYMGARFEEAVEMLSKAIALQPGWKTAAGFRAICRWTAGDADGARSDALLALQLKPNDAESFVARAFGQFVLKKYDAAADDFRGALEKDPDYALAHFGMGSVLSSQERPQEALPYLNRAVKLAPRAAIMYVVRGTVRDKIKDFPHAIADYSKVIKLAPTFKWAYYYRGRDHRELKDYRAAVSDLSEFIRAHPDFEDALYFRSNAYFLSGDYVSAAADLDAVLALNPDHGLALANRGQARAEAGDREGALADLRRAKALLPAKAEQLQRTIDSVESAPAKAVSSGPEPPAEPARPGAEAPDGGPLQFKAPKGVAAAEPSLPSDADLDAAFGKQPKRTMIDAMPPRSRPDTEEEPSEDAPRKPPVEGKPPAPGAPEDPEDRAYGGQRPEAELPPPSKVPRRGSAPAGLKPEQEEGDPIILR